MAKRPGRTRAARAHATSPAAGRKRPPRLHLEVLDAPQRRLWDELSATPPQFMLYGGTALALRLGHRKSADFDFFTGETFDPLTLKATIAYLEGGENSQEARGTLSCIIDRGGEIYVSYFCPPKPLRVLGEPYACKQPQLTLAPLIDIAATKINVVAARSSAKDYLDIHALITKAKIDLATQLCAVPLVFSEPLYNPLIALKALSYFGDLKDGTLPAAVKRDLARAVAAVDHATLEARRQELVAEPEKWKQYS